MEIQVVTDLTLEPVTVQLAADWCKLAVPVTQGEVGSVTLTSEGEIVAMLITSARQWCEKYTGLSFGTKTLRAILSYEDYGGARTLPYGPNQTIISATDANGNAVDLEQFNSTTYWAEYQKGYTVQNRLGGEYGGYGPAMEYTIEYTAGYTPPTLPMGFKQAILKTVADLYQNRENTVVGTIIAELPMDAKALLDLHKPNVLF